MVPICCNFYTAVCIFLPYHLQYHHTTSLLYMYCSSSLARMSSSGIKVSSLHYFWLIHMQKTARTRESTISMSFTDRGKHVSTFFQEHEIDDSQSQSKVDNQVHEITPAINIPKLNGLSDLLHIFTSMVADVQRV